MKRFLASALLLACSACVSGSKIRADSEVIQADVERARRSGALRCAPVELATADYVDWFNNKRLHTAIGGILRPAEYEAAYYAQTQPDAEAGPNT